MPLQPLWRTEPGWAVFAKAYPERLFDVGIAEGHAVSMAAGMAKQGMIPVFAVYSTFLQRSYDMLFHDVALQKLHVVLGVDRAGLVGADGETHHGLSGHIVPDRHPGLYRAVSLQPIRVAFHDAAGII